MGEQPDPSPEESQEVDLHAIAQHLAQLEDAEREIHVQSSSSIARWLVETYQMAMARASAIAPRIQEILLTLGLG